MIYHVYGKENEEVKLFYEVYDEQSAIELADRLWHETGESVCVLGSDWSIHREGKKNDLCRVQETGTGRI